jgi:two-component system, cell cycle response regulator
MSHLESVDPRAELLADPRRADVRHETGPLRLVIVSARAVDAERARAVSVSTGLQIRVCAGPTRVSDALRVIMRGEADAVLLALGWAEGGMRAFTRLYGTAPSVPIVVVVDEDEQAIAAEAVRLGAQDYLLREELTTEHIARAIVLGIERNRRLVALRDLSLTDPLTGLYNRRGFVLLAEAHLRLLRRTRRRSLLVFADLDGLKRINDGHGHAAGDHAIVEASRVIASSLRESDIVARWGGDEFVALAHDAGHGAANAVSARIRAGIAEVNDSEQLPYRISVGLGIVSCDGGEVGLADIMSRADRALYRSKRRRRWRSRPREATAKVA